MKYICEECGKVFKRYRKNHEYRFCFRVSRDNSLDNLVTLCKPCHSHLGPMYYSNPNKYFSIIGDLIK